MTGRRRTAPRSRTWGLWKRAWYFPRAGEYDACGGRARVPHDPRKRRPVRRLHARQDRGRRPRRGGIPRAHVRQRLLKLEVGRCRYGLMLSEAGFLMDDGVIARLAPDRFHVTTTTGGAAARARAYGGLSPDRVHRSQGLADLDDRAMGDDRRAGAESARLRRAAGRRRRSCQGSHAAHERARSARLRRSRAAHAGELHRRTRLRDQRALALRPRRLGGGVARSSKAAAAALTAPRRCT